SMRINFILAYVVILCLESCIALIPKAGSTTAGQPLKVLEYADRVYEPGLKTVQFFAQTANLNGTRPSISPIISLAQTPSIVLTFDIIGEEAPALRAKILHCDRDWKPSSLNEIEYLNAFNEFVLQSYQLSFNTRLPFYHFRWELPASKSVVIISWWFMPKTIPRIIGFRAA
ncbi:MAG: DUF5103 domain-containing protein, partial [Microscillaceae bacterium]|nr:DUF5103 domain-containing protein [Microscillaceae bacterium]